MTQYLPTLDELEALLVNNPDLHRIKSHLGRFNPIKVMGMAHMEIRHSAILRWLLDPQESHGLGDVFLKSFLTEAVRGGDGISDPTALDILRSDMMDADVRSEWRNIDLLILSPRNGWVFVVENKFHSGQHTNQLARYMDVAHSTFIAAGSYDHVRGVFLTLWDEDPNDHRYVKIRYDAVCQLLEQVLATRTHPLSAEVATFIEHYLQVIRETVHMDKERLKLEKLARELYRDHKKVLDFIVENGKSTDFALAAEAVFGQGAVYPDVCTVDGAKFVYSNADSGAVSFLPVSWFNAFGGDEYYWHGCEEWWAGFPLITWIQLTSGADGTSGQIRLYGEVGPLADHAFRTELIGAIQSCSETEKQLRIKFQRGATDEGRRYSRFFKKNAFPVDDIHDHDKIAIVVQKALKSFRPEFEAIAKVLPPFVSHGKEEEFH
ncbi:MAG: PDDEXK-like family protein [Roseinatronobacter sp.]